MKISDETKKKIYIYLLVSYVILVPLINNYVKILEKAIRKRFAHGRYKYIKFIYSYIQM